jgi:hypothetical protein
MSGAGDQRFPTAVTVVILYEDGFVKRYVAEGDVNVVRTVKEHEGERVREFVEIDATVIRETNGARPVQVVVEQAQELLDDIAQVIIERWDGVNEPAFRAVVERSWKLGEALAQAGWPGIEPERRDYQQGSLFDGP